MSPFSTDEGGQHFLTYKISTTPNLSALSGVQISSTSAQSTKCVPCPAQGQTGDSRCKLSSNNSVNSTISGCPSCGCQKCPDGKIYANAAKDYCLATPSNSCGPKPTCRIACLRDDRCTSLAYDDDLNPNAISCLCACQKCPDRKIYATSDYEKDQALTIEEEKQCPHVRYPVQPIKDLCS